jgi:hypothetical protein
MEELLRLQPDALGTAKARGMDATQVAIRDLEAMQVVSRRRASRHAVRKDEGGPLEVLL